VLHRLIFTLIGAALCFVGGGVVVGMLYAGKVGDMKATALILHAERDAARAQITNTDELSQRLAAACSSMIKVRVQHQKEVEVIRDEVAAGSDPWDAYDRVLCRRPEAAGHPRCQPSTGGAVPMPSVANSGTP
jgi:hypothetical protein